MRHQRPVFLILLVLLLLWPVTTSAQDNVHVVQPGENLYRIGLRYGISVAVIAQANNISNTAQIYAGQSLVIPDMSEAVDNPLIAAEPTYHVVQPGENLTSIANRYGLTVDQLIRINNISNPNRIERGQTLTVFEASPADGTQAPVEEAPAEEAAVPVDLPAVDYINYIVQPGETLAQIAQRFNVAWPVIVETNNITNPNHIEAGQTIIIPNAENATTGILSVPEPLMTGPAATITTGKQIIVDLSDSRIYAYQDGQLVRSVLASTGLPATPTVQGNFTVQRKYTSQTMSGPGYYLPGVQWIMYFYAGYAIHGTYWHNNFGQPMSHGCVNLPNEEALWFYEFAPVGTPVLVQL